LGEAGKFEATPRVLQGRPHPWVRRSRAAGPLCGPNGRSA